MGGMLASTLRKTFRNGHPFFIWVPDTAPYNAGMPHTLIYGGTFDPIHHGHLIACQRAREILSADGILLIPARISPHKASRRAASGEHRLAMIHRAIAGNPFFLADGRELLREGPSYTIDTLSALRAEDPSRRLTLLLGADQLSA